MKNTLSIMITLAILLSSSSMATLDSILDQFAKLEISYINSNLGDHSSMCSNLDALIANNSSMPEAWLPQSCCDDEVKLKKIIEMIREHDLSDCLSQLEDCGEVVDKLLLLKDHEYYHYILFQTVMGLRSHCSTDEFGVSCHFSDKYAGGSQICGNVIQGKIESLTLGGRNFEERQYFSRKCRDVSIINVEHREEELESEPLQSNYFNLGKTDKTSENSLCASVLLYMSEGNRRSFIGKVYRTGELVTSSNIAAWWLELKEFEYGTMDLKENIVECKQNPGSAELDKSFSRNRCPSEGIYFEVSEFIEVICDVAISLSKWQEKRYLVSSSIHDMGLCIKRNKYNNIIIYYYDPNDTLRHKEIIANAVEDLQYLHYYDFWNPIHLYSYFPGQDKVCCLTSLHTKSLQKDCKVVCTNKPSASLMYLLNKYGHYGHSAAFFDLKAFDKNKKKELIAGERKGGTSALYIACQDGRLEAVSALLTVITNVDLDPDVKKELLAGRRADGTPSLYIACQNEYHKIVTILLAAICSGDINLNNAQKVELLVSKNAGGCSALNQACQNGYSEIVIALLAAICSEDLNLKNAQKVELLAGKDKNGFHALYKACQNGDYEIVTALIDAICSDNLNLNNAKKAELLASKNADGCSALNQACQNGHLDIVIALIAAICSNNLNVRNTKKVALLAGKDKYGFHALYKACQNGYREIVTALIAAICCDDLNLNNVQKVELLAGENKYGFHALNQACQNGHYEIVTALIAVICRDDLNLNNVQKVELLAGGHGCSALNRACQNGHLKIVTALITAICSYDLNLKNDQKVELLAGKDKYGFHALYKARQNGHHEIVTILIAAICSDDLNLNNAQKVELLAGKNKY
ncbi:MAG: ankyrin repeat domain-containing protein [Candidatus Endonucleobacter bathymodioli]|uniref:Ankyrin repeat domain-containing protein n=1 Tax=Candidatus Endonucleibacter bathymodioli TaxID=539814 RepID=A0AA90P0R8_9GAMM|nr:ankyrin repeat domain-containing protein [Candidatus Endonucleobacter bathymodioli]